jgi:hypothetical protein
MTDHPDPTAVVKSALLREAAQNVAAGQRLTDGRWMGEGDYQAARRATRRLHWRESVEAVVFWAMGALIGMAFMLVVVAIL